MAILYDQIGRHYNATRAADPRIVDRLCELLGLSPGKTICDVGAGSGNYSNALAERGFKMLAVEPSSSMRSQAAPQKNVSWYRGSAEALPLEDHAADGVICTLAAHHFRDLEKAFSEIARICENGPIVFFTLDPRLRPTTWIERYFEPVREIDLSSFLPASRFLSLGEAMLKRTGTLTSFALPPDLLDGFLFARWNTPEAYLDAGFRENASGFARADKAVIAAGVERLRDDLANGKWDADFGSVRGKSEFQGGFYFARFVKGG